MYPGKYAVERADQPCFIMAGTGETVTYAEFEARTNRLAHVLREAGLGFRDHYTVFMENNARYLEACGAGERTGLYCTAANSHLTATELAYILENSESRALIASAATLPVAAAAAAQVPAVELLLVVDDAGVLTPADRGRFRDFADATSVHPDTPVADERRGRVMLYSSGTTGRPKGILYELPDVPPDTLLDPQEFLASLYGYREGITYLSPAPLYHSGPQGAVGLTIRMGGTVIIMERFDAEEYLRLVDKYRVTHSQLVPTMFSRMLKLPDEVRLSYDVSSLEVVVHAAAPCPVPVKEQMIDWWGPIILEYYGATEAMGFVACTSEEWLAHKGTVGRVVFGELHVCDDDMNEVPAGITGTLWFVMSKPVRYFNDPERSKEAHSPDGRMCTVGDVGYVDEDGFVYLTDRKTFMIISGGVNIYPQETENLLITHPMVADAAVFGIPHPDLGEEVKAAVELLPGVEAGPELADELIQFCRDNLSRHKCPRSIDFEDKLPRLATGKLYKRQLRDKYWADGPARI
ncbi:AMP-binding protein [Nocardia aurantia]|uniref:Long-chain-fatty-acid--CoA ligase n=1 Tax=Nocardia aurantia TaxID=2585199 RepID=A0A7K0E187_9NOCA|nr:AMP-binding protein [Nocardia aurantia]MQY31850.1 Long-chain-fatty-acid--CoA ligase [Nocardia aurantia]